MFQIFIAIFVLIFFYYIFTRNFNYWKLRNVVHDRPLPIFGNHFQNASGLKSLTNVLTELYYKYPGEKIVGYYKGNEPALVIRDLDLIRDILNVDFTYFHARGAALNPEAEPLLKNLFHVDGDVWKLLRKRLTPAFTATRLKNMFPLISQCAEKLQALIEDKAKHGEVCDVRNLMSRFTIEFIGACGFGIDMDTICNENSAFLHLGKLVFQRTRKDVILLGIMELFPQTRKYIQLADADMYNLIADIVLTAFKWRDYKPSGRNDFIDLLLLLSQEGKIVGESIEKRNADGTPATVELTLDEELLVAQVFVFYAAGFETSSFATSVTLHKLAFHPQIQDKVQQEIDEVLESYNGKLCYEAISKMTYLEMVFKESMRMFSSFGFLQRVCCQKYTNPSLGVTIDPGVIIYIPTQAIQNDGKYFENPSEFCPERFSPEATNCYKYSYLPFGEGPRGCIVPLLGNHFRNLFGIKSLTQLSTELYYKYPEEKVVGYYRGNTPDLIIRDLDIARHILSVDFIHFYPRALGRNPDIEPLFVNLFHVDGDKWKLLRQRLTPAFTTAKLKAMFPLIINCAEKLQIVGDKIDKSGGDFDSRELMARFTTDFIGACGFGIEMDSINNEHSAFRELGRNMFTRYIYEIILTAIWQLFPEVRNVLRVRNSDIEDAISKIVTSIFEQRKYKPSGRNDFIDLLLELSEKGKIEGESIEHIDNNGTPKHIEMELRTIDLIAQVFIFFAAGFETSSSATSFTLHQLALHPDIQNKIQNEIDEVLAKYDNKLCFDAISEFTLLDMAFKEAMRLFPSLGFLHRQCARRYTIPELGITIDPGVNIILPIQAIQTDEKYFENAKEFRPERFKNAKNMNKYIYLPFGEGPRACIGARLGQMQSLAGLAAILQKFTVEPSEKTPMELPINPWSNVVQSVQGGIPLKLKRRN